MKKSQSSICFLLNPAAGRKDPELLLRSIQKEAEARWITYEVATIQPEDSVADLAKQKSDQFDIVVACGGDGTVNSVVNGLAETKATLGVLPIGTGNDFAKAIQVNGSLIHSFDILESKKALPLDLIQYSGDAEGWCANTLGMGLDGLANYYSKSYKWLTGPIVYVIGAIKAAWNFRGSNVELTVDGKIMKKEMVMMTACNGKWEGGKFYLAPDADLRDGFINFITIGKISFPRILFYLPFFRWGPKKWMKELNSELVRHIEVRTAQPFAVHADGEHIGSDIKSLNVRIVPGTLNVITGY
jgi:diacylglycerol kinase (ATP)